MQRPKAAKVVPACAKGCTDAGCERHSPPTINAIFKAADGVVPATAPAAAEALLASHGSLPRGLWTAAARHGLFTDVKQSVMQGIPPLMRAYFDLLPKKLLEGGLTPEQATTETREAQSTESEAEAYCTKLPHFQYIMEAGNRVMTGRSSARAEAEALVRFGVLPFGFWTGMITHACTLRTEYRILIDIRIIMDEYFLLLEAAAEKAVRTNKVGPKGEAPTRLADLVKEAKASETKVTAIIHKCRHDAACK